MQVFIIRLIRHINRALCEPVEAKTPFDNHSNVCPFFCMKFSAIIVQAIYNIFLNIPPLPKILGVLINKPLIIFRPSTFEDLAPRTIVVFMLISYKDSQPPSKVSWQRPIARMRIRRDKGRHCNEIRFASNPNIPKSSLLLLVKDRF